jgi:hypothetical protein
LRNEGDGKEIWERRGKKIICMCKINRGEEI